MHDHEGSALRSLAGMLQEAVVLLTRAAEVTVAASRVPPTAGGDLHAQDKHLLITALTDEVVYSPSVTGPTKEAYLELLERLRREWYPVTYRGPKVPDPPPPPPPPLAPDQAHDQWLLIMRACRAADESFRAAGDAGTKTWLREHFLPELRDHGLGVTRLPEVLDPYEAKCVRLALHQLGKKSHGGEFAEQLAARFHRPDEPTVPGLIVEERTEPELPLDEWWQLREASEDGRWVTVALANRLLDVVSGSGSFDGPWVRISDGGGVEVSWTTDRGETQVLVMGDGGVLWRLA